MLRAVVRACMLAGAIAGCAPASDRGPADSVPSGGVPDTAPPAGSGAPEEVVRAYYEAIDARDYRRAYALWARDGAASHQTYDEFAGGFAQTARVTVTIDGPVRNEGAAGSIYAEVPVVVRATTRGGGAQRFEGTYTLRRVNDVPGSTAEQRRWHIESADIRAIDR